MTMLTLFSRDSKMCNYTNPTHGEPWFCIMPPSGECGNITTQEKTKNTDKYVFSHQIMNMTEDLPNKIRIYDGEITVNSEISVSEKQLKTSKAVSMTTGWLEDGHWRSTLRFNEQVHIPTLSQCLKNSEVFFVGDSVILRWFNFFKGISGAKNKNPPDNIFWSRSADAFSSLHNTYLHYR